MDYIELKATILPLEIGRDVFVAELAEIGFESFVETEKGVQAYVQSELFDENLLNGLNILKNKQFKIDYSTKVIEDQNWNEVWEKSFDPINVEQKCYVRAPFHEKIEGFDFDIIIEPKMSFGTGHHDTTYLMIKHLMNVDLTEKSVLDMGCGTGVLAILAKMKKASTVYAIDIDEWAYENTKENILINNLGEIDVYMGGAEKIGENKFDIVLANINRNILLNDMHVYAKALNQNGTIFFSGFFNSDVPILQQEAEKNGLAFQFQEERNEWTMLQFKKN